MIYSIFIYSSISGLLMWEKSFEDVSAGKLEMFSSFFSAIKSFIQEMVLKGDNELKTIEMGDYILKINSISSLNIDLVAIASKDDEKKLKKVFPQINKILKQNSILFEGTWDGQQNKFKILNTPILNVIANVKGLIDKSETITDGQSEILKSIWSFKEEIDPSIRSELNEDREYLRKKLEKTNKIVEKNKILTQIIELDEKLRDDTVFIEDQSLKNKFDHEISDIKMKLEHYLVQTKTNLEETMMKGGSKTLLQLDYSQTYIPLISFTAKLKSAGMKEKADKYLKLSQVLTNKEKYDKDYLLKTITKILRMEDNINFYFKEESLLSKINKTNTI
ncbi:MAG: hypothetical protein GY870_08065 [archaeon]|nr:hypothetical protein [archaeon]